MKKKEGINQGDSRGDEFLFQAERQKKKIAEELPAYVNTLTRSVAFYVAAGNEQFSLDFFHNLEKTFLSYSFAQEFG